MGSQKEVGEVKPKESLELNLTAKRDGIVLSHCWLFTTRTWLPAWERLWNMGRKAHNIPGSPVGRAAPFLHSETHLQGCAGTAG